MAAVPEADKIHTSSLSPGEIHGLQKKETDRVEDENSNKECNK